MKRRNSARVASGWRVPNQGDVQGTVRRKRTDLRMPMIRQMFGLSLALSVSLAAAPALAVKPVQKLKARPGATRPAVTLSPSFSNGVLNFNRGFIAKAIPAFQQATRENPADPMGYLWLAKAYQKQGTPSDFARARTQYQKVLALAPNNLEALTNLGEMWSWDASTRSNAIQLLQRAISQSPNNPVVARHLAEAYLWNGQSAEALRAATPAVRAYGGDHKWLGEYAQMLLENDRASEALALYRTSLKKEAAEDPGTQLNLSRALLKIDQKQAALGVFIALNNRLSLGKTHPTPDMANAMAGTAFDLGVYPLSLNWDESLPSAYQNDKENQLRQARSLTHTSRRPEAIDKFYALYQAGQLNADEKVEFAAYLQSLHLDASALPTPTLIETLYQAAAQENPNSGDASLNLARQLAQQDGHFDETVTAYQQAMQSQDETTQHTAQQELLGLIKGNKTDLPKVTALFTQLLSASPNDIPTQSAYAEFLSYQPEHRADALRLFLKLYQQDAADAPVWQAHIEEVLLWQKPDVTQVPLYEAILAQYPTSRAAGLAEARAYAADKTDAKTNTPKALDQYTKLIQAFPKDATIEKEWLTLMVGDAAHRAQHIKTLKTLSDAQPDDLTLLSTYGKLLSYNHQYGPAMQAFDKVLSQNNTQRDALVGKGLTLLWSGRKFEAKKHFQTLHAQYPDDSEIALGLAQANKQIGRYDQALEIMKTLQPQMEDNTPSSDKSPSGNADERSFQFVAYTPESGVDQTLLTYDYSIEPPATRENAVPSLTQITSNTSENPPASLNDLHDDVDALNTALESLKLVQKSAAAQIKRLDQVVRHQTGTPQETSLLPEASPIQGMILQNMTAGTGNGSAGAGLINGHAGQPTQGLVGADGMRSVYGSYDGLNYDTNPLLSGMGRFKNDDVENLQHSVTNELRPVFQTGGFFSRQDGQKTTTRFDTWGLANQASFSLTPQTRVRFGFQPTRFWLPSGVAPDKDWGMQYSVGATAKYWDRLTLDGDLGLTRFNTSKSTNITFQTQMKYDFNDAISAKLGIRRVPQYNSLLSITGLRPTAGARDGQLLGQARENGIYGELNTHPLSQNWDWNLGYEWAFVDGSQIPRNRKNQAFTSLGYTWHYAAEHQVRLGYELLYFGYSKNGTNGFFNTTATGADVPVSNLNPITAANSGYVYGGYYSPKFFLMNSARLEFQGNLFNKFLEYKLGGSLGAQTVGLGHGIKEDGNGTSLAKSMDLNLIMNFKDWLATYADVDYLDAGGQFNRWRFGGGLIIRPKIDAISSVFGKTASATTGKSNNGTPLTIPGSNSIGAPVDANTPVAPANSGPDASMQNGTDNNNVTRDNNTAMPDNGNSPAASENGMAPSESSPADTSTPANGDDGSYRSPGPDAGGTQPDSDHSGDTPPPGAWMRGNQ